MGAWSPWPPAFRGLAQLRLGAEPFFLPAQNWSEGRGWAQGLVAGGEREAPDSGGPGSSLSPATRHPLTLNMILTFWEPPIPRQ